MDYGACDSEDAPHAKRISYWIGTDGTVRQAYPNVDAARHPDEILRDIEP